MVAEKASYAQSGAANAVTATSSKVAAGKRDWPMKSGRGSQTPSSR